MLAFAVLHSLAGRAGAPKTRRGQEESEMIRRAAAAFLSVTIVLGAGAALTGCEKGPMQKAGEKVDEATGQDRIIGKGPAEKTGRKVDNTVNDLKK